MLKKVSPYSKLSAIYDFVMHHVDYQRWYTFVQEACRLYNLKPSRVAEIACGTGTLLQYLSRDGFRPVGLDLCYGMLAQARQKNGPGLPLVQGTMATLPFKGAFDLILCLYDSINYLLEESEVVRFLQDAGRLLRTGGLFIFDICTEFNSLHYFLDIVDSDTGPDFYFERRSRYRKKEKVQENNFKLYLREGGRLMKFKEAHRQRIYPQDCLETLIDRAGLFTFRACDGFTLKPPTFNTTRIHYLLRLKEAAG